MGLAHTKKLKAVKFWVNKKLREDAPCDLMELTDDKIAQLIREMSAVHCTVHFISVAVQYTLLLVSKTYSSTMSMYSMWIYR
jgi:hypothetical protein